MFFKALRRAIEETRKEKRVRRYLRVVSAEPFTVELMKAICKDYGHHFQFDFSNGDSLKFPKIAELNTTPFINEEEAIYGG